MIARASLLFLALILSSCNLFRRSQDSGEDYPPLVYNMDTASITPEEPRPAVYRAAATQVSDIIHTKLDVSFDWSKQWMYGKATITAKPYFYPQNTLVLDARGMEIQEVMLLSNGSVKPAGSGKKGAAGGPEMGAEMAVVRRALEYKYEKDVLTIQLDKEYKNTEEYTVYISYVSKPNELAKGGGSAAITDDKGLYFINPEGKEKNKPTQLWTQGETQATSVWMPTIDRPNERMTQEIYMTVDKKYVTLSNGELSSSSDNGDGTRTDHWKMDLPHAPYLAMMAVGDFAVVKDTKWRGKEVNYYVEKEYEPYAKNIFGNTPEMLEFFSNRLGVEYPWVKYSQIVARDYVSGAMENTTATLHSEYLQRTDRELLDKDYEDYISHELFHQWFGDLVTCESWSNLPLNESFATYGEYLWQEYKYGRDAADAHSAESRAGYLAESERKQVNLVRFEYDDKEDMFDGHSYNKGGQVLHMLRKYVGDDAFFASLKLYLETNKFTSAEIHQLRIAFEKVTGEDLNWFFNQWFLSPGHPELVIRTDYDAQNKKQKINIRQVQDFSKTPLFRIPMYIDIYADGKVDRKKIVIEKADEDFYFDVPGEPDLVNVDAEKQLLCTRDEKKTVKQWVFQYKHAPLYLDRYEAIVNLKQQKDSIAEATIVAALNDPSWSNRLEAIQSFTDGFGDSFSSQIREKMIQLAQKDPKSTVRAVATDYLATHYKGADLEAIYKKGMEDRSYYVLSSSMSAIAKVNPEEGMKCAKQYENEKNLDVLYTVADIYSSHGTDDNNDFFLRSADKFTGFSMIGFVSQYGAFLKRAKRDETVNGGVDLLAGIAKNESTNKWVAYYAKKAIKDIILSYDEKILVNTQKIKLQKEANPNAPVAELEMQVERDKAQRERVINVLNGIK